MLSTPDLVKLEDRGVLLEKSEDNRLAVHGGDCGDTDVDGVHSRAGEFDSPVLGKPSLRDVHSAEELDSGGYCGELADGRPEDGLEEAVDSEADLDIVFIGFDMDVAGAGLLCASEDVVDQPDDGRLLCEVPERLLRVPVHPREILVRPVIDRGEEPVHV